MKHQWLDGELEEFWWLTESEEQFIHERSHDNRLVYVVMLKYFQIERQFRNASGASMEATTNSY